VLRSEASRAALREGLAEALAPAFEGRPTAAVPATLGKKNNPPGKMRPAVQILD